MSQRITQRDLEGSARALNQALDRPAEPYTKTADGQYRANVGNLHVSGAYGGWQLHEMVSEGGAIRVVSTGGYVPKRDLYEQIHAMLNLHYSEESRRQDVTR